ncbi:MAG: DUF3772 domain-containing protein [Pseudomonadota bacterium]
MSARAAARGNGPRRAGSALWLIAFALAWLAGSPADARSLGEEVARLVPIWERAAAAAEATLVNRAVPESVLEEMRRQLADQRDEAEDLVDQALAVEQPLRVQLEALGPAPDDGTVEAEAIARQRGALATQLAEAEIPVKAAQSAFRRADDLVDRIDARIRLEFRNALLARASSPLAPANWAIALDNLTDRLTRELRDGSAGLARVAPPTLIVALALAALGLFVLIWLRVAVISHFERRLAAVVEAGGATLGIRHTLNGFGLTLAALLVPGIGVLAILQALQLAGLVNGAAAPLIRDINMLALCMVVAYWLSETLFGTNAPTRGIFPLEPQKARGAQRYTMFLGLVAGADQVLIRGASAAWRELATLNVLSFLLVLVGCWALWRLASMVQNRSIVHARPSDPEEEEDPRAALGFAVRTLLSQIARIVILAAPLLAAFGFYAGSRYLFFSTLFTGAMIGGCIVIIGLISRTVDVIEKRRGLEEVSRLALLPVLAGVALASLALPILALIWGARQSDLSETWRLMIEGVSIGETRISPFDFLIFVVVFAVGLYATRLLQGLLRVTVLPQTRLEIGAQKALAAIAGYIGVTVAALAAISTAGLDLSSLAIVAGALSVGIGFGLQTIVSNFVSGLILLIERPIKEGDWIKVGEIEGTVRRISVRATAIQTFDRAIVTVPNADFITASVMNRTHRSTMGRIIVKVGVAYGTDTRMVEALLRKAAEPCEYLLKRPAPIVVFTGFGPDALEFSVYCYLRDVNLMLAATNDMNHRVAEALRDAAIEIPYAQRDLHLRNSEEIARAFAAQAPAVARPRSNGPETEAGA